MANKLSYENFEKIMNTLLRYEKYEGLLADLNVNIWEQEDVAKLKNNYVGLVKFMLNDYRDRIDYFTCDCEWGNNPNVITDEGEQITLSNLKDVYDMIEKDNEEE